MKYPLHYTSEIRGEPGTRKYFRAVSHNWDLVFSVPPAALGVSWDHLSGWNPEWTALSNNLNINCQSVTPPNTNISTVEGNIRGVRFHQIQTRASTQIQTQVVFYEPSDYPLYGFLEFWKTSTVHRHDAAQRPDNKISEGISLILYDTDRQHKVLEYKLYDTYCGSAQISDPNASGALQTVTATLVSSNYGIIAYNSEDEKTFAAVPGNDAGYLGRDGEWVSGDGETRKV